MVVSQFVLSISQMATELSPRFTGMMVTLDAVPPVIIPFPFAPENYLDTFNAEYETKGSPGSRYKYPMFKGNSGREISYTLRFDQHFPTSNVGMATSYIADKVALLGDNIGTKIILAQEIQAAISCFEKLKLPKQGIGAAMQSVAGNFVRANPGGDPSPPLVLLIANPYKMYLGYVGQADIRHLRYNQLMLPTRIEVAVKLLVTPDLIFTTIEDVLREINVGLGYGTGMIGYKP